MNATATTATQTLFTKSHREHLEEHGYVVVKGVVSKEKCAKALQGILKHQERFNPELREDNPAAWIADNLPAGTIHGIGREAAYLQEQLDMRQDERVTQVFAEIYGVGPYDLVTSSDAYNFYLANGPRMDPTRAKGWPHVDQGPAPNPSDPSSAPLGGMCVQGFVNCVDALTPFNGTLVVCDRSHRAHAGYFASIRDTRAKDYATAQKGNWHRFSEEEIAELSRDGRKYLSPSDPAYGSSAPLPMDRVQVFAEAGDLVLWYSRTIHENQAPDPKRSTHHRCVIYVCQAPRKYLSAKDVKMRKKAWEEKRQTSHWPCGNQVKIFGKPTIYPEKLTGEKLKHFNDLQRQHGIDKAKDYQYKCSVEKRERELAKFERIRKWQVTNPPKLTKLGRSLMGL